MGRAEYLRRLGLYLPAHAWKHLALGLLLALCTLAGMLLASVLTGRYEVDWSAINLQQSFFSLNAGLWEEAFYRGIIMAVLLRLTPSVRRAALLQIVIFGFAHFKGMDDLWSAVDMFSVMLMAVAFTYTAWKTRTLVAGIVFHFLHDAFLFFVQVPRGEFSGFREHATFYLILWTMVGVACLLTKLAAERSGVAAEEPLYRVSAASSARPTA